MSKRYTISEYVTFALQNEWETEGANPEEAEFRLWHNAQPYADQYDLTVEQIRRELKRRGFDFSK